MERVAIPRCARDFRMKLGGFQRKRRNEPRGRARGKRKRCGTAAPGCAEDSTSMWIALRELSYGGYRYHFENEKPIRSSGKIPEMPAQRGGSDLIKVRQTRHLVVALLKLRVGFSVTAEGGCATPLV
jgi:hypothetical protein